MIITFCLYKKITTVDCRINNKSSAQTRRECWKNNNTYLDVRGYVRSESKMIILSKLIESKQDKVGFILFLFYVL